MIDSEVTPVVEKSERRDQKKELYPVLDSLRTTSKAFEMYFCNAITDNQFEEKELRELGRQIEFIQECIEKIKLNLESEMLTLPEVVMTRINNTLEATRTLERHLKVGAITNPIVFEKGFFITQAAATLEGYLAGMESRKL